jgi:hypothetical protein
MIAARAGAASSGIGSPFSLFSATMRGLTSMSKQRAAFSLLIPLALLVAALPARAWNATGHEVVAEIAWRNLKPEVRAKVLAVLKNHPHFAKRLEPHDPNSEPVDYALRVFMLASNWPDMVRSGNPGEREYHHAPWHYIDYPIIPEGTDRSKLELPPVGEKLEPGKSPENILQALQWASERVKDPDAPAAEKAVALAWIIHLVGDIHQPLHTVGVFSNEYPSGDRGGNLFMVKYHGSVTNLHRFWDDLLGGYMSFKLVDAVADKVVEKHPRASLEKELAVTKPVEWAAESSSLARKVVYLDGKLKGITREASVADQGASTPELPENYDQTARDTARLRVALAGYRLADLLNILLE